jgi:hypothetical protein
MKNTTEVYRGITLTVNGWGVSAPSINCFCGTVEAAKARIDTLHAEATAKGLTLA